MEATRFASALSTNADTAQAVREVVDALVADLDGRSPDLLATFVSHHHGAAFDDLGERIRRETGATRLFGCTGDSIVGGAREVEQGPALSVWALATPDPAVNLCRIEAVPGGGDQPRFDALPDVADPARATLLLLADPFSFPVREFLDELERERPGLCAVGGLASGGTGPGQNLLFADGQVVDGGAVGVLLEGGIEVRTVVSQGCHPVGRPWVITECEGHMLRRLGGKPAARALIDTLQSLEEAQRDVFQRQPFVGLAVDANQTAFARGDFLARNVLGMQQNSGALAVSDDSIRRGQTVQFMVRDSRTASEDLEQLLAREGCAEWPATDPVGALLFTCNGRGRGMFTVADHDVTSIQTAFDHQVPAAGFFANGEIGPVGGRNFLHGYTASVALFRDRPEER